MALAWLLLAAITGAANDQEDKSAEAEQDDDAHGLELLAREDDGAEDGDEDEDARDFEREQ